MRDVKYSMVGLFVILTGWVAIILPPQSPTHIVAGVMLQIAGGLMVINGCR